MSCPSCCYWMIVEFFAHLCLTTGKDYVKLLMGMFSFAVETLVLVQDADNSNISSTLNN